MPDREKVIKGLECCNRATDHYPCDVPECPYREWHESCMDMLRDDALSILKPRVMTLEEVIALPYGYVLIETDKNGSLRWVDALLFCKNTNFSFDFITLEGRVRLLGAEYNKEWRCWTSRPDEKVRAETPWE